MKYLILIIQLIFSFSAFAQNYNSTQIKQIIAEVSEQDAGVIIGVVKDKKLIHTHSRGLANLDYHIPISAVTRFRLSSTSKQFTAAAIHLLALDGKLSLEDKIKSFFPDFSEKLGNVTVSQLLYHTSGIRDYMSLMILQASPKISFDSFTGEDEDIAQLLSRQTDLSFTSGEQHDYSNTNYWLLAKIVEQVSGESFEKFTKDNIFSPLKMENSFFVEMRGQIVPDRAAGYVSPCPDCPRIEYREQANTVGGDGMVSSVNDLLLWENEFHDPQVFSKKFWKNMRRGGKLNNGEKIYYASGLMNGMYKGEKMVSHSGQNPGYSSDIIRFPAQDLSIIILANQNWYDTRSYGQQVAALFFPDDKPTETPSNTKEKNAVVLNTEALDRFCGDYYFVETKEYRTIKREGNELIYVRNNGPSSKLVTLSDSCLTFEKRKAVTMNFTFDAEGGKHIEWIDGIMYQHADDYEKPPVSKEILQNLVANYHSEELSVDLDISMEGEKLLLPALGRKIPMEAIATDEFSAMGVFTLKFIRDKKERVIGLRLNAPRAGNIYFSRE